MGCPALNGYPCEPCGAQVQIWRAFCHRRSGAKKILYPYVKNIQSHNPLKMKGKYSTCDITYVHLLSNVLGPYVACFPSDVACSHQSSFMASPKLSFIEVG